MSLARLRLCCTPALLSASFRGFSTSLVTHSDAFSVAAARTADPGGVILEQCTRSSAAHEAQFKEPPTTIELAKAVPGLTLIEVLPDWVEDSSVELVERTPAVAPSTASQSDVDGAAETVSSSGDWLNIGEIPGSLIVRVSDDTPITPNTVLRIRIPYTFSVNIKCEGDINFADKLEAREAVFATSHSGSVYAKKLRTGLLVIKAPNGGVHVSAAAEAGTLRCTSRTVDIKRLFARTAHVHGEHDISIPALYTSTTHLQSSNGSVRLGGLHGCANIDAATAVDVTGVSGALYAKSASGDVTVQFDDLTGRSDFVAEQGEVSVTLPSPVSVRLEHEGEDLELDLPEEYVTEGGEHEGTRRMSICVPPDDADAGRGSGKISNLGRRNATYGRGGPAGGGDAEEDLHSVRIKAGKTARVDTLSWLQRALKKKNFNLKF